MASDAASRLLVAAERGDNNTLVELLHQSVSPDVQNASHFTPLILAAYAGNIAGIKILLSRGAKLNATTLSGNSAIMMAAQNGKSDTVLYLNSIMKVPINTIRNKTGDTPLMFASKNGHTETVKVLLKLGARQDAANVTGTTAIFCAASDGHVEVLKELTASSDPKLLQAQDSNGNTPLHFAAIGGHIGVVEFLLTHGASPFIRNRHDKTPLMDISDELPNFKDDKLIQNVNSCRTILLEKSKELEELSQKNMDNLTKLEHPEPSKKQTTKQPKTKHKKNKSASQIQPDTDLKDNLPNETESANEPPEIQTDFDNAPKITPILAVEPTPPNPPITKTLPLGPTQLSSTESTLSTHSTTQTKSQPLDIPKNQTLSTGPSPTSGISPSSGKSPELYSTILKTPSPSAGLYAANAKPSNTDAKANSITNLTGPPGFPLKQPPNKPTSTNLQPTSTKPILKDTSFSNNIISPSKTTYSPPSTDTALLDQTLSYLSSLDSTQSIGHPLEVAYRDYNDMSTAITSIHPNAVALDLPVKAMLGLGLNELSMEQLGVLEEMHHKMLQAITDAKLEVVRNQERMRLEEQNQLEIALLTNKLRSVE